MKTYILYSELNHAIIDNTCNVLKFSVQSQFFISLLLYTALHEFKCI